MKRLLLIVLALVACAAVALAQVSGNVAYSQAGGRAKAEQNERNKRILTKEEMPPTGASMFIDASVLMNVKADQFVATFAVSQEGTTVAECQEKMDAAIKDFSGELKSLGIGGDEVYVDFVAQNKIYGYAVEGDIAKEKLVGFELKKNVSIHYKDKALLDKLVIAASKTKIFDLVKVDYVVSDTTGVQNRLMEEAAAAIKQKATRYEKLLGTKLLPPAQVYAERPSIYYPTEMYDAYTAAESEEIVRYRQNYTIQGARKTKTFYFHPLSGDGFDRVVNPVVLEPVVQFTLYLKVKYKIEQPKGK